jgi:hypothetical protein
MMHVPFAKSPIQREQRLAGFAIVHTDFISDALTAGSSNMSAAQCAAMIFGIPIRR